MPFTDPEVRRRRALAFMRRTKPRVGPAGSRAPVQADDGAVVDLAAVRLAREKVGLARDEAALAQQIGVLGKVEDFRSAVGAAAVAYRQGFETLIANTLLLVPKEARAAVRACLVAGEESIGDAIGQALGSTGQGRVDRSAEASGAG